MTATENRPEIISEAESGDLETLRDCLQRNDDVNVRDTKQASIDQTPLMCACSADHVKIAKALVVAGAEVNAISRQDRSFSHGERMMLFHTSWEDCEQSGTPMGWTALHLAARYGHLDCLNLLLANGAEIDLPTAFGSPPLHVAIEAKQLEAVRCLIGSGANVNARDHDKSTPLHVAAFWNQAEAAKELLQCPKLKLDLKDQEGLTPLHVAITEGSRDVLRLLIEAGADLAKKTRDGRDGSEIAQEVGGATKRLFFELTNAKQPELTNEQIYAAIENSDLDTLGQVSSTMWNQLRDTSAFHGWTPLATPASTVT